MKRRDAAPTAKDVAREAGASLETASKGCNGVPAREDDRAPAEEAADRPAEQVNRCAPGRRTSQSRMAALLLPEIADPRCAAFAEALCRALARRDYRMILALSHGDPEEERRNVLLMERHGVDGIIGVSCAPEADGGDRVPFVRVCDLDAGPDVPQALARLAENCVDLLLRESDGEPAQICIDGVTLIRNAGRSA